MKIICITLCFLLISASGLAVEVVKKDDIVPFDGILFTHKEELDLRIKVIEYEGLEKRFEVTEQMVEVYKRAYEDTDKQLEKQLKRKKFQKIGFFLMGVGLAFGATWSAGQLR